MQALLFQKALQTQALLPIGRILSKINCKTQIKQCGWLFNCIFWGPPPLTEPGRNTAKNMPTVRNSGAANIAYPVDLDSVAFLPEPVKGMPLRGGYVCLWLRI